LLTDIILTIDPACGRVVVTSARNLIVHGESVVNGGSGEVRVSPLYLRYDSDPAVDRLVRRYADAATPLADAFAGWLGGSVNRTKS
jgi:hypothetical protein